VAQTFSKALANGAIAVLLVAPIPQTWRPGLVFAPLMAVYNWTDSRPEYRYDRALTRMERMAAMSLVE
jgi:hypothetical protein